MARTPQEELVHFVSDLYSVELQALAQLKNAPEIAGEPGLAAVLRTHHQETTRQAEMMRMRLESLGGEPSKIKDAIMKLGGKAFLLFAQAMPETPGRLLAHCYSYEAMEWAGYSNLISLAQVNRDTETAAAAMTIRTEEQSMMNRLADLFDAVEAFSHRDVPQDEMKEQVRKHLSEAHAIESQNVKLLEKGEKIAGEAELADLYSRHLAETHQHIKLLEERLEVLGGKRSLIQDAALALGGMNWGLFFQAQPDTPCKLAAFIYAVEHLEIASYELLIRTARRAGDPETEEVCRNIAGQERSMASHVSELLDLSVQATLYDLSSDS